MYNPGKMSLHKKKQVNPGTVGKYYCLWGCELIDKSSAWQVEGGGFPDVMGKQQAVAVSVCFRPHGLLYTQRIS